MSFNFGTTSFGTTATTTTSSFTFGAPAKTTASGFGSTGFNFGTTTQNTGFSFGATTTTTNTGFSLGGLTSTTNTGFGGFGTGLGTTGSTSLFGTTPATTTSSGFSFGFGQTATTTSAPSLFSGFGQTTQAQTGFGTFGAKPLGTNTTPNTGFGGFSFGSGGTFGQQQQPAQQQIQQPGTTQQGTLNGLDPVYSSVFYVCMFGDERDEILSKWNLLQACWGTGKGYFAPNIPPVDYTPQNPLCRFKGVAYNVKPSTESREGLVAIHFNKKEEEIRNDESQLLSSLNVILGSKPHIVVNIDSIRPLSESSTVVYMFVEEKAPNGMSRRVNNQEVCQFLMGTTPKQQLTNLGVVDLFVHSGLDMATLQQYLDNPPNGIDKSIWKQAQADNPDPERFIPVGVVGFDEVRWRAQCQVLENKKHGALIDKLAEEVASLERENQAQKAKILECRTSIVQLEHRLLKVLVKQEVTRNVGVALRPEEEVLRSQLDTIHSQLNSPQIKGRLNELLSQIRMHKQEVSQQDFDSYSMAPGVQEELKQFLSLQQNGIKALLEILQNDLDDMEIMKKDLAKVFGKVVGPVV